MSQCFRIVAFFGVVAVAVVDYFEVEACIHLIFIVD